MVLLLTVNFRVAHLDRCIESSGPAASPSSTLLGSMGRELRAEPDQPALSARAAGIGPVAVSTPLQLRSREGRFEVTTRSEI